MKNIKHINIDNEDLLVVTTDTDFEETYRLGDNCRIVMDGLSMFGKIAAIYPDHLILLTQTLFTVVYDTILDIEKIE